MLDVICGLLSKLSDPESATQSMFSVDAFNAFIELIRCVYGDHAASSVAECCELQGEVYVFFEDAEQALRICLQGNG